MSAADPTIARKHRLYAGAACFVLAAVLGASPVWAKAKAKLPAAPAAAVPAPAAAVQEPRIDVTVTLNGFADGLAAFTRNGSLWLVGEGDERRSEPRASGGTMAEIGHFDRIPADGATVLRATVSPAAVPAVTRTATGWQVRLTNTNDHAPVANSTLGNETGVSMLTIAIPGAGKPVRITDPEAGDTFLAIPAPAGAGFGAARRFAEFELLPAAQGVVVHPLADGIAVTADAEAISIGTARGIRLSDPVDRTVVVAVADDKEVAAAKIRSERILLDWPAWHLPAEKPDEMRRKLEHQAALAANMDKAAALLDLARLMLAGHRGPETLGYLNQALAANPDLDARDDVRMVRGAALAIAGRREEAEKDLSRFGIAETGDADLWHALMDSQAGDWQAAQSGFREGLDRMAAYPDPLYRAFALGAIEAAIRGKDIAMAKVLIDQFRERPGLADSATEALAYFDGLIADAAGKPDAALAAWKGLLTGHDQYYRTRAELASVETSLKMKTIDTKTAVERLDRLRFAWRGDQFENEVLGVLGDIALKAKDYETAQTAFRQVAALNETGPAADEAHRSLTQMFHTLFVDGAADSLPPIRMLALFHSMRDLAPDGADGDKALDRLAERMIQMDLLPQGADIIEGEAQRQTDPAGKAQLGARAAALRLLDGKPELAVRALDASEAEGATPEIKTNRKLLRVRAFSKEGRVDEALNLLGGDSGPAADALRVDIGWAGQRWRVAADALIRLIGPAPADAHIDDAKANLVLRRAIALNLLQDQAGIAALRRDFAPALAATKSAPQFEVLTRPTGDGGLANPAIIRSQIAEVDMFKAFLSAYGSRPGA